MNKDPFIIEETEDFAVVFKPPKMHSALLKEKKYSDADAGNSGKETLFEWYSSKNNNLKVPVFCEMMHRLDFETHGLVLFARNQKSFTHFKDLQEKGGFIKEYSAVCIKSDVKDSGFPPPPVISNFVPSNDKPILIESWFRPFGRGRKLVRPVTEIKKNRETAKDRGGLYRTEITFINGNVFTARIKRGFRHQIRCHLCWIGFPVQNDPIYSNSVENGQFLALRAHALFFTDPSTGRKREYRINALEKAPF